MLVSGVSGCGPKPYDAARNLSYDPSIGYQGTFDFYEPKADSVRADRPAILAIHGGAWRGGDKAWGEQFAKELCPYGYVVFSINYRLSSRPNGTWPAQIEDVQKALKHIRANARQYRIDPARIASLGVSAGGHLATMVALRDDPAGPDGRVRAAINLDGEHDMTMPPEQVMDDFDEIMTDVMGHRPPWSEAELRDISTVTFARPDVSLLTVHGAGDDNVYVMQGDRVTAALRARGAEAEFIRLEGRAGECHTDCWKVPRAKSAMHRFLARKLSHDANRFFEDSSGAGSATARPGKWRPLVVRFKLSRCEAFSASRIAFEPSPSSTCALPCLLPRAPGFPPAAWRLWPCSWPAWRWDRGGGPPPALRRATRPSPWAWRRAPAPRPWSWKWSAAWAGSPFRRLGGCG
jgi:acetyl esterase/lipase